MLSELAGAAQELREALIINPYDIEAFADALTRALDVPREERRTRMRAMRRIVAGRNVFGWASDILEGLEVSGRSRCNTPLAPRKTRPCNEFTSFVRKNTVETGWNIFLRLGIVAPWDRRSFRRASQHPAVGNFLRLSSLTQFAQATVPR